jgi:hypothetical protein
VYQLDRADLGITGDPLDHQDGLVWGETDTPDLVIAMRLLDRLKLCGFEFQRSAPGDDGGLIGHRISDERVDLILIEGFSRDCFAWRQRTTTLIAPGSGLVERQINGSAIDVMNELLTWEPGL